MDDYTASRRAPAASESAEKIDFGKQIATVIYDPDETKPEALTTSTTDAGLPLDVRNDAANATVVENKC